VTFHATVSYTKPTNGSRLEPIGLIIDCIHVVYFVLLTSIVLSHAIYNYKDTAIDIMLRYNIYVWGKKEY